MHLNNWPLKSVIRKFECLTLIHPIKNVHRIKNDNKYYRDK
jgi:hypothetical protein